MRRRPEFGQINTLEHWNKAHLGSHVPFPGLDTYFTLLYYYRLLLEEKGYPDIFSFGSKWLDYGCGNAADRLTVLNIPEGIKYVGCDFADSVQQKNSKLRPDITWLKSPQGKGNYGLITSIHTFEHLDDPKKTWQDLWALEPGVLIVQVPYARSFYDEQHLWEFDENSFETPVPPIVIIGPKMNLQEDREICYVWYKDRHPKERVICRPYRDQYSPQGWFLWHMREGFGFHYWPTMFGKKLGFIKKTFLYNFLKKIKVI